MQAPRMLVRIALAAAVLVSLALAGGSETPASSSACAWREFPAPKVAKGYLQALDSSSARDIWAVGEYDPAPGPATGNVAALALHWDGRAWSRVPMPSGWTSLRDVAVISPADAWAVGYSGKAGVSPILRWRGKSWQRFPVPGLGRVSLFGVGASAADDVWAVGMEDLRPLVLHWNGRTWRRVAPPALPGVSASDGLITTSRLFGVAALSKNDAWLVGESSGGSPLPGPALAHWDGRAWTLVDVPAGLSDNPLERVAALAPDDVWVVGLAGAAHWDGTEWSGDPLEGVPGPGAIAPVTARDVWVADPLTHWDGSAWKVVRQPDTWHAAALEAAGARNIWAVGWTVYPAKDRGRSLVLRYSCGA